MLVCYLCRKPIKDELVSAEVEWGVCYLDRLCYNKIMLKQMQTDRDTDYQFDQFCKSNNL